MVSVAPFRGVVIQYLDNVESYAGGSIVLLVGSPKPDRSIDRGQTKQHRRSDGT